MIVYKYEKDFEKEQLAELFHSVGWFSGNFPEKLQLAFHNASKVISAWDGNRLVGLVRGLDDGAWQANVDCLLVNPEYQGQGIAANLLKQLLDMYADFLYVYVLPEEKQNVTFYEKHGFYVMSEGTPMQIKNETWTV